ncbi:hypothetical protein W97_08403 [Coniosporium apollinis CBS 100218]|uniref:Uncharacterized protein n=1 Tax=Coniosporium apollinis (strain CBS 100218) TaxID=1168221 RepID=R7Z4K4_CONA1|nr:uncharacterized protein W97_08403 [Coniosporium apollinis CBS 100218]EON69090.1 hypothetical protein W97_08403 [Coniosporium apollinis CBS 100218]
MSSSKPPFKLTPLDKGWDDDDDDAALEREVRTLRAKNEEAAAKNRDVEWQRKQLEQRLMDMLLTTDSFLHAAKQALQSQASAQSCLVEWIEKFKEVVKKGASMEDKESVA